MLLAAAGVTFADAASAAGVDLGAFSTSFSSSLLDSSLLELSALGLASGAAGGLSSGLRSSDAGAVGA